MNNEKDPRMIKPANKTALIAAAAIGIGAALGFGAAKLDLSTGELPTNGATGGGAVRCISCSPACPEAC